MIIIITNNNKISLNLSFTIKKTLVKTIPCISINDTIENSKNIYRINISIILITLDNSKIINILRHSGAHLLAHAVKNIYKTPQFYVGPVIQNGFYYDFFIKKRITDNDLIDIKNEMLKIAHKGFPIIKYKLKINGVKKLFNKNKYKLDILKSIKQNSVTLYKQNNFIDLCLGPHVNNTDIIKYINLFKISGAYWKNDNTNDMLHRIYGNVYNSKKQLQEYTINNVVNNLEHRKLGYNLNLYCFDEHSQGVVFWNTNGLAVFEKITKYLKTHAFENKFYEVRTPQILNSYLFQKSGHMDKFSENMFIYKNISNKIDVLKPMNCPCHINIFNNFYKKSYKDLPHRIYEFGSCFRNELSGTLHGIMRLKNFTQDDAHILCEIKHIDNEIKNFISILKNIYFNFNFKLFKVNISKKPDKALGNNLIWTEAENLLEKSINEMNIKYSTSNDGAFYGPKIEFSLKDKMGRYWQCGTIQVDFFSSKRLNASYSDKDGMLKYPIILHRAILGSIERFLGILIENTQGLLPFWLTPIQFEILFINNQYLNFAKKVYNVIIKKHTAKLSIVNDRLEYKIKKSILEKTPYIIIIGEKEFKNKILTIRCLKSNNNVKLKINTLIKDIKLKKL